MVRACCVGGGASMDVKRLCAGMERVPSAPLPPAAALLG
jgi:hypothetical protein